MPNINDINGVTVANLAKLDAVLKANISKVNGLTLAAAFTGLLDTYTGAVRAYSVRRLNSAYTGAAIRIREAGGNTETDINFDSDGFVNLADIVSHCGANAGYVKTWYDQSQSGGTGSGNDATQATPADQPQIYDGTSLRLVNGRLGVGYSTGVLLSFSTFTVSADVYIASVQQYDLGEFAYGGPTCFFFYSTTTQARFRGFGSDLNGTLDLRDTGTQEAFGVVRSGTAAEMFWQGGSVGTVTASSNPTLRDLFDGQNQQGGRYNQSLQEFILWDADHSASQASIDADINSNFLIYQPTDAPTSGLLYDYGSATGGTDAAAAYSVRQLSDKAVIAMRIRRDSDDEERNIGFDSNGDLDTTAISAFCGTANGYVTRWWDQSTNGNHATQSTPVRQPQIYNGTAVYQSNSKPAIYVDPPTTNIACMLELGTAVTMDSIFMVVQKQVIDTPVPAIYYITGNSAANADNGVGIGGSAVGDDAVYYDGVTSFPSLQSTTSVGTTQRLISVHADATTDSLALDGTEEDTGTVSPSTIANIFNRRTNNDANRFEGYCQEMIIWDTDQSSNRTGIETNIDDYFQIPGM